MKKNLMLYVTYTLLYLSMSYASFESLKMQSTGGSAKYSITDHESFLTRFYRDPQMQTLLKKTVGDTLYNTFLKRKTAVKNEEDALTKNPYPWEQFTEKPSYWQRTQNWLYNKSNGVMGKKIHSFHIEQYKFPNTKEGKRAELLKVFHDAYPYNYKDIWLRKTTWDKFSKGIEKDLAFTYGRVPEFGELWLQKPLRLQSIEQKKLEPQPQRMIE